MRFHCEYCGTSYKAEIADMKVLGSSLVISCKKCGRDVVAVGGQHQTAPATHPLRNGGTILTLDEEDIAPAVPATAPAVAPDSAPSASPAESVFPQAAFPIPAPAEAATARPPVEPGRGGSPRPESGFGANLPRFAAPEPPRRTKLAPILAIVCFVAGAGVVFLLASTKHPDPKTPARETAPAPATLPPAAPTPMPSPAQTPVAAQPETTFAVREIPAATPRATAAKPTVPAPTKVRSERDALAAESIDRDAFEERAGKIITHVRLCARLEQARNPDVSLATVGVIVVVGPSGAVTNVSLDQPKLQSSPFGTCLRDELKKLVFPSFSGAPVEVRRTVSVESAPGG